MNCKAEAHECDDVSTKACRCSDGGGCPNAGAPTPAAPRRPCPHPARARRTRPSSGVYTYIYSVCCRPRPSRLLHSCPCGRRPLAHPRARPTQNTARKDTPMCGIVGYTGSEQAKDILIGGLKRLEYRGYDSAGVALERGDGAGLDVFRRVGKVFRPRIRARAPRPRLDVRHRPHALGNARPPLRGQRAPALELRRPHLHRP